MQIQSPRLLDLLGQVKIFRLLSQSQLHKIAGVLHERHFAAGETIFEQDDTGDCLYIIAEGFVRIYLLHIDGREMTIRVYGRGDAFGEFAVLDGKPRTATAVALSNATTLVIYRHEFLDLMRHNFDLVTQLINELTERLRFTTRFSQNLVFLDASGRIAAALTDLADQQAAGDAGVRLALTQQDLASYANVTREWANKALRVLAEHAVIRVERGAVVVLDLQRLRFWSERQPAPRGQREVAL